MLPESSQTVGPCVLDGSFRRIKGANTQPLGVGIDGPATTAHSLGLAFVAVPVKFTAKRGESPEPDIKSLNKRVKTRYKQVAGQFSASPLKFNKITKGAAHEILYRTRK